MNKIKKIMCYIAVLALSLTVVGCSNNVSDNDETVTLKWLVPGDSQADLTTVLNEVNKITEKEIGAKIDMQIIDTGSFSEKMKLSMASGNDFDLCFTGFANNYLEAVNNGGLMDIPEMIDEIDGMRDILPDYVWEMATVKGKIYGVPNMQIMASTSSLIINGDIAEKYNYDMSGVKKIDDIEPYLEIIKKNEPDKFAYSPGFGVIPWYTQYYEDITSFISIPKGSKSADDLVYIYETDEYKHGMEQLWNWYSKGYIRPDALSVGDQSADNKNGKFAVMNGLWKPGAEAQQKLTYNRDDSFIQIATPYLTKDKGLATMISVGAKCKNPGKALEFIKLVNTNKELYNLICFGIEGKHYTLNADGKVVVNKDAGYAQGDGAWKFGNTFNALLTEGQDDNIWTETEKINNDAVKSELLGFTFDNRAVRTQISNIATIKSEYEVINKGVKDPATYYDEFCKKLKEAGVEDVYNEVHRQLEEYFKNK